MSFTALIEDTVVNQKALDGLSLSGLKEALINTRQHEAFLSILLVSLRFLNNMQSINQDHKIAKPQLFRGFPKH